MRWVAGIVAVLAVEFSLGVALLTMFMEENCGNGVDRWSCDDTLQFVLLVAFGTVPAVALALTLRALSGRSRR